MSYARVIPRDLFNEAKLLKCMGQLAILLHDCPGPLTLSHRPWACPETGHFIIEQDSSSGGLFCSNLTLLLRGRPVPLQTCYNSRKEYPLVYTDWNGGEEAVFDEHGQFSAEFLAFIK